MRTADAEAIAVSHPVVSREQWIAERKMLLAREKELTRRRDQIARERRALPWVRIEKGYVFDAPEGGRAHDRYQPAPLAKVAPAVGSCCEAHPRRASGLDAGARLLRSLGQKPGAA